MLVWRDEGKEVCQLETHGGGECQWVGGGKKYKSGKADWKKFSCNEPTGGNGSAFNKGILETSSVPLYC